MSCRKNFLGTEKRVWTSHGKRVIGIWAIEVLLYVEKKNRKKNILINFLVLWCNKDEKWTANKKSEQDLFAWRDSLYVFKYLDCLAFWDIKSLGLQQM